MLRVSLTNWTAENVFERRTLVWNRVWFLKELRECVNVFIVSIPNELERKRNTRIRNGFEEFFVCALI